MLNKSGITFSMEMQSPRRPLCRIEFLFRRKSAALNLVARTWQLFSNHFELAGFPRCLSACQRTTE
jgi:hypothetical protein